MTLVNEDPNRLIEITKVNDEAFNVLNHGDCWLNNIMFQHDDQGNVLETIFVDFQLCKYGSPSEDLYYVLFSSTQNGLVVQEFDYFIRYYHDNLMQSLDILKYDGPRPSLRELHEDMLQSGNQGILIKGFKIEFCI